MAASDSNSVSASPCKQPWEARNGHENGPRRFPLVLKRHNMKFPPFSGQVAKLKKSEDNLLSKDGRH